MFAKGFLALIGVSGITKGNGYLTLISDGHKLATTKQAGRRGYDSARFDHTEPAGDHHRMIRATQKDTIAGD